MAEKKSLPVLQDDRRTQKTKKALAAALAELIAEKGFDAITIQEIIDRANIGRSTFYAHYESKEQLLVGNIHFQNELIHTPTGDDKQYPMGINLSYLFHHTKEYFPVVKALRGSRGMDIICNHFAEVCAAKIHEHYKGNTMKDRKAQKILRYKAAAAAAGIVAMLFKWLEDGATIPAEEMIGYARTILETFVV
ncbi:TetR/AcrR family transcriptional regulator [Flavitalea flava]